MLNPGRMPAVAFPAPGVRRAFVVPGTDRRRYAPRPALATYYI
jgi:hypothetical protein